MSAPTGVPDWIEVHEGTAPMLLLAPHGGRRTVSRHPGRHKVNDLHTAELTRELASACGATAIVNGIRDRNELDLNRIEAVRRHAPWLPVLLADALQTMLARAGRVTVVVIHGWNVVQAACDVGVGLVERDGRCVPAPGGHATASDRFIDERIRPLQRLGSSLGVAVTIGARYPAAHPNNLLQLFTSAHTDDPDLTMRRIGGIADRIDAVQLELGIPLRWPGPRRDAFTTLLARILRGEQPFPEAAVPGSVETAAVPWLGCGGRVSTRRAVQFVDGDLVGMSGVDADEKGGVAGRLLVSAGADHLALFTGELAHRGTGTLCVPALEYQERATGTLRIEYRGPLLVFPNLTPFTDLEGGLARGRLVEAAVDLTFSPDRHTADADPGYGRFGVIGGTLALGAPPRRIEAIAHTTTHERSATGPPTAVPVRVTAPGTPVGHLALTGRHTEPRDVGQDAEAPHALQLAGTRYGPDAGPVRAAGTLALGATGGWIHLEIQSATTPIALDGILERVIPVRRPGPAGSVLETRYALCRWRGSPPGWLEFTTRRSSS